MELRLNSKERLSFASNLSKELTGKRGSLPQRKAFLNMFNKIEPNWLLERFPAVKSRRRQKNYYSHSNVYFAVNIYCRSVKHPQAKSSNRSTKEISETLKKIIGHYNSKPRKRNASHNDRIHPDNSAVSYSHFKNIVRRHTNWKETSENLSLRKEGSLKENLCRTRPAKKLKLPRIEKHLVAPNNNGTPVSHTKNLQSIFKTASHNKDVKGVVKDYGFGSKAGRQVNAKAKVNQDSIIVDTKIGNDWCLFGIADGHGQFGEQVSGFVRTVFPRTLS